MTWNYYSRIHSLESSIPASLFRRTDAGIAQRWNRATRRWTPIDDAFLRDMISEGDVTLDEISEAQATHFMETWSVAIR